MKSRQPGGTVLSRRQFVKAAGVSAAAAGLGLLGGQAPAFAQKVTLHILEPVSFIPAVDEQIKALAQEFGQANGCTVRPEFINLNDLLPRATAAIEARHGADVILLQWNQGWRFGDGLADVGDVVKAAGGDTIHRFNRDACLVNGVYRGVPYYNIGSALTYNMALLARGGVTRLPETYDELLKTGTTLKRAGFPVGWCLGRAREDSAFGSYPILWAFGGAEVDEQGRVAINSRETRAALEWFRQFWNDACDPAGLAWNDIGNNQAFLGESVSIVLNAASIYLKARNDGNHKLAGAMRHTVAPAGPGGRFHLLQQHNHHIPAYTRNLKLAKDWLTFLGQPAQYERMLGAAGGFVQGIAPLWDAHPLWKQDPILEPFQELARYGRNIGFKGPYNRASSQSQAKFIVATLLARTLKEGTDGAIKWAEGELKRVYERV